MLDGWKSSEDGRDKKRNLFVIGMGQREEGEREKGEQRTRANVMFGEIL